MSKNKDLVVVHNTINNNNQTSNKRPERGWIKWAAIITVISGLIIIYAYFEPDIIAYFNSDYDPNVEHVIETNN